MLRGINRAKGAKGVCDRMGGLRVDGSREGRVGGPIRAVCVWTCVAL
jgi:hypothetical protein